MTREEAKVILKGFMENPLFSDIPKVCRAFDMAIKALEQDMYNELPPVQPKSRWIPVSERLPEKGGDYLVTTKWKGSYSGDVYTETNMAVYREKEKEWDCTGVVAWMPLPEPYEPTNQK